MLPSQKRGAKAPPAAPPRDSRTSTGGDKRTLFWAARITEGVRERKVRMCMRMCR